MFAVTRECYNIRELRGSYRIVISVSCVSNSRLEVCVTVPGVETRERRICDIRKTSAEGIGQVDGAGLMWSDSKPAQHWKSAPVHGCHSSDVFGHGRSI